jgi:maltose O-acetyltransferase
MSNPMHPRLPQPKTDETPEQMKFMLTGQPYHASDPYISRVRDAAGVKLQEINKINDMGERMGAMREFLDMGKDVYIVQGFFCEYVSQGLNGSRILI